MGRSIPDNTNAAAQAADDAWSERGLETQPELPVIEIFAGTGCKYCVKAKELCEQQGLKYRYVNIDDDFEAFDQLVGRIKQWQTVPQIFAGNKHIGGCDDFEKYLGLA